ncbi:hypothetical protein Naga_100766g1, partial [Nannochloropsis gaditana]
MHTCHDSSSTFLFYLFLIGHSLTSFCRQAQARATSCKNKGPNKKIKYRPMTPPAVIKETVLPADETVAKKQKIANGHGKASAAAADSQAAVTVLNDENVNTPDARIYEYVSACNPDMPPIPALAHPPELHASGPTRVIAFDLSAHMGVDYEATSPNLLAAYVRVLRGESIETQACATSQAFYVIRGQGKSTSTEHSLQVTYKEGD